MPTSCGLVGLPFSEPPARAVAALRYSAISFNLAHRPSANSFIWFVSGSKLAGNVAGYSAGLIRVRHDLHVKRSAPSDEEMANTNGKVSGGETENDAGIPSDKVGANMGNWKAAVTVREAVLRRMSWICHVDGYRVKIHRLFYPRIHRQRGRE